MAGFLKSMVGGIINAASANINPYKVQAVHPDTLKQGSLVQSEDCVFLYKQPGCYEAILYNKQAYTKAFSLFRITSEGEARTFHTNLAPKLVMLYNSSTYVYKDSVLQQICDCVREHLTWSACHVAAFTGLLDVYRQPYIARYINAGCPVTGITPLMAAVLGSKTTCIPELLMSGAHIGMADQSGNTVFHHAVKQSSPEMISVFCGRHGPVLDWVNGHGQTALYLACSSGKVDCVEALLNLGADPSSTACDMFPIHGAVKAGYQKCVSAILERHPRQLEARDGVSGGSPLFWAQNTEMLDFIVHLGCNVNAMNSNGDTVLHIAIERNNRECAMSLLCHGVDVNVKGQQGNTSLHLAAKQDDMDLVQSLVVFGTDPDTHNDQLQTARHLVATSATKNRDAVLYILHLSGANRCLHNVHGCLNGCVAGGNYNGAPDKATKEMMEKAKLVYEDSLDAALSSPSITRSQSLPPEMLASLRNGPKIEIDRVLCLDGGGIRGLIIIQILMALQRIIGQPIVECFDWIGGTSTGGILALGIAMGKSLQHMLGLYFGLKDKVFIGKRPYTSEPFEDLLKREFGENTVMADIQGTKVLVSSVLADRRPAELHLFRNFKPPMKHREAEHKKGIYFHPPQPEDQLVWKAARCSGAAPTYFRSCECYVDGGVIANNPTMDVLTEIHEYNVGMKFTNPAYKEKPLGVVVSVGTGKSPIVSVQSVDICRPEGIADAWKAVKQFTAMVNLLVQQVTESDGRHVERARAWCSMINVPYFRFQPQLSEDIALDCHDNKTLIQMMWETHCYILANRGKLIELAQLLCSDGVPCQASL